MRGWNRARRPAVNVKTPGKPGRRREQESGRRLFARNAQAEDERGDGADGHHAEQR